MALQLVFANYDKPHMPLPTIFIFASLRAVSDIGRCSNKHVSGHCNGDSATIKQRDKK
jgi:hypothetical protein